MFQWLSALGGIILVDLVLSGDNALVIGAAASSLPRRERIWAIVSGGVGAIILRICFAILAGFLFKVPLLGVIGGVILLFIAVNLLVDRSKEARKSTEEKEQQQKELSRKGSKGFFASLITILIADATMSLDNILAVGAIAEGQVWFIIIGLIVSIALLLVSSALIAELIERLPWLLDIACLVLAWTAAHILLGDDSVEHFFNSLPALQILTFVLAFIIVLAVDIYLRARDRKFQRQAAEMRTK